MNEGAGADRVLVLNPASGSADHDERVERLARDRGFAVRRTEEAGDAVRLAHGAAESADLVAACGGDGTINEVVTGLRSADALGDVDLAVVPAGTGNNFAGNLGIRGVDHAFEVLDGGETRRIDVGLVETAPGADEPPGPAAEWLFVNSCVCGLTAEASSETSTDSKSQLGTVAYAVETLKEAVEFDGLPLAVEATGDAAWELEAMLLLVGNARSAPDGEGGQADMEDGEFELTAVEERPALDLAGDVAAAQLLGDEANHVQRTTAPSLTVSVHDGEAVFSLDGEMITTSRLDLRTAPGVLPVRVGPDYDPSPS